MFVLCGEVRYKCGACGSVRGDGFLRFGLCVGEGRRVGENTKPNLFVRRVEDSE